MDCRNIPDIDKKEFARLVNEARAKSDFSIDRLGELVSNIVNKIICKEYYSCTEDWQAEMFSDGVCDIFNAISNDAINMDDPFSYCYTAAINKMGRTAKKLMDNIPVETVTEIESDPFYLRNKRRLLRGRFGKDKQKEVVKEIFGKKRPSLKNAVGVSARLFSENFSNSQLDGLIEMARSVRG